MGCRWRKESSCEAEKPVLPSFAASEQYLRTADARNGNERDRIIGLGASKEARPQVSPLYVQMITIWRRPVQVKDSREWTFDKPIISKICKSPRRGLVSAIAVPHAATLSISISKCAFYSVFVGSITNCLPMKLWRGC